jgi:hypothetical protein
MDPQQIFKSPIRFSQEMLNNLDMYLFKTEPCEKKNYSLLWGGNTPNK